MLPAVNDSRITCGITYVKRLDNTNKFCLLWTFKYSGGNNMSNLNANPNRLQGKDLINVGIFTAIYFVIVLVVAMLSFIPVFLPLLAIIVPLVGGIPFMLFLTKVNKFGMILIMSVIMGIMMLLTGMGIYPLIVRIVTGLIAEFVYKSGNYKSAFKAVLTYAVFSMWLWGNYVLFFTNRDKYFESRKNFGQDYIDALEKLMPMWMFLTLLVCAFVMGLVGGFIGKSMLKKHFEKAGIA